MTHRRERGRVRAREPRRRAGGDLAARRACARVGRMRSTSGAARRSSSPAASCSASASRRRSRSSRSCCSSTSRRRSSIPRRPGFCSQPSSGSARRSSSPSTASRGRSSSRRASSSSTAAVSLLDAPRAEAVEWLAAERPLYTKACVETTQAPPGAVVRGAPRRLVLVPAGHARSGRGRPRAAPRRDRRARGAERVRKDHAGADRRGPRRAAGRHGRAAWPRRVSLAGSGPLPRQGDRPRRGRARRERG